MTTANDLGIFAWNGYSVSLLVREGDVVAGRTVVDLAGPGPSVRLNNNGEVFFLAALNAGQTGLLRTNIPHTPPTWTMAPTPARPTGASRSMTSSITSACSAAGHDPADLDDGTGAGLPDGGVTIDDLIFFLIHFFNGC